MNMRNYFTMFKNEPDVLTVPDVIRLLRMGKNTVYKLLKEICKWFQILSIFIDIFIY